MTAPMQPARPVLSLPRESMVKLGACVNSAECSAQEAESASGVGASVLHPQGGMQEAIGIEWVPPREPNVFVRGDVNGDGQISVVDSMAILYWLNVTGPGAVGPAAHPPAWTSGFPCHDAADADDDGWLSKFDALKILVYVFMGNVTLPAPSASSYNYIASDCGEDLTGDSLGCDMESAICQ